MRAGAGAVVPPGMHIPPGMLALGVPAKVVGPLSPPQQAQARLAAEHYVTRKEEYRSGRW